MQPCPCAPVGTVVQREGWCAGVWAAGQRGLSIQQKWADKVLGSWARERQIWYLGWGQLLPWCRLGASWLGAVLQGRNCAAGKSWLLCTI